MAGNEDLAQQVQEMEEKLESKQQELEKIQKKYGEIVAGFEESRVAYDPELDIMRENVRELACDIAKQQLDLAVLKEKKKARRA